MDIYLPGPAVTTFGTFPAGINAGVSEAAAAHLALYHGAVAYAPGSHPRVLDAQKAAAFDALVSEAGNITAADLATTTGTLGQTVRLSDGPDQGAILMWSTPQGASSPTWCWWLWPQAAY